MNKKLTILTSILALTVAMPTYADISANESNPSCVEDTLDTASGTSNLTAAWNANRINVQWYDGDTQVTSNTCTYDSTLTIPLASSMTKTGYTFGGWKIRAAAAQCSLASLDTSIDTEWDNQHARWKPINGASGSLMSDMEICEGLGDCTYWDENSADLANGEWAVTFSYGTVKGMAKCSAQAGNNHNWAWGGNSADWTSTEAALDAASGEAKYCWCQATNYTPNGGSMCSVASPAWVFDNDAGSADGCAGNCAIYCAAKVQGISDFRLAVFGQ